MARFPGRYAIIGFLVSKLAMPVVKRSIKSKAKRMPGDAARAGAHAVKSSPAKVSLGVGAALGAAGYLVSRRLQHEDAGEE